MVKGVLYSTAGTRRAVVALDAATGELLWVHSLKTRARAAPRPPGGYRDAGSRTGATASRSGSCT